MTKFTNLQLKVCVCARVCVCVCVCVAWIKEEEEKRVVATPVVTECGNGCRRARSIWKEMKERMVEWK